MMVGKERQYMYSFRERKYSPTLKLKKQKLERSWKAERRAAGQGSGGSADKAVTGVRGLQLPASIWTRSRLGGWPHIAHWRPTGARATNLNVYTSFCAPHSIKCLCSQIPSLNPQMKGLICPGPVRSSPLPRLFLSSNRSQSRLDLFYWSMSDQVKSVLSGNKDSVRI